MTLPLIIHVPHASTAIPAEVTGSFLLEPEALRTEILRMTDWFTDTLFATPPELAAMIMAPISRLVVDVERFRDDARECMASYGMGVIYTRTADRQPLRAPLSEAARERWLMGWYDPHHAALERAVGGAIADAGHCLIIDAHSFPSAPLLYELDQSPSRPDICLGTDPYHTPLWLCEHVRKYFEAMNWSVEINRPFAGTIVPQGHYRKVHIAASLMIEVNRKLYMDEATGIRGARFQEVQEAIQRLMHELSELSWTP
jgi:N-formylglutamate amidohydrolase